MNLSSRLSQAWRAPFLRTAVLGALALIAIAFVILIIYELALARVPEHRAMLERLVRAQTGLDMRFNELSLRWGWYGPEAVFRHVELGEPGSSQVLLRAPQLVVGFDAWGSVQAGQLRAGQLTLVAPDIDMTGHVRGRAVSAARAGTANAQTPLSLLSRWQGGRIEVQGGSLKFSDPMDTTAIMTLQVHRATLRRSKNLWSLSSLVFLPERLGHSAHIAAQATGDIERPRGMKGTLRFDGVDLVLAGWQRLMDLPVAGDGNVSFRVSFDRGRFESADGSLSLRDASFTGSPWFEPAHAGAALYLKTLAGNWRLLQGRQGWQLRSEGIDLGTERRSVWPALSIDVSPGGGHVKGELGEAPVASVAALAAWLVPELNVAGLALEGDVRGLRFQWDGAAPAGERLSVAAQSRNLSLGLASGAYVLSGMEARLAAHEQSAQIVLSSGDARLALAHDPQHPLAHLGVVSSWSLNAGEPYWHAATDDTTISMSASAGAGQPGGAGTARLTVNGQVGTLAGTPSPWLKLSGEIANVDLPLVRRLLDEPTYRRFGPVVGALTGGRIPLAHFSYETDGEFSGFAELRDGELAAGETWPQVSALEGRLSWKGDELAASIEGARAGSLAVTELTGEWRAQGGSRAHVSATARGHIEEAAQWLAAHPKLMAWAPQLATLPVKGEALVNLDVGLAEKGPATTRVALGLENAELSLASDLPAVGSVRGTLALNNRRLQRSTLTAQWLGGPMSLKVSQRRGTQLAIVAQGFLDARRLTALAGFERLAEVEGQTPWNGEVIWDPARRGRWQLRADSSLIGVTSRLPEPLGKSVLAPMPLHVEASGAGERAELVIHVADHVRGEFALARQGSRTESQGAPGWLVDRGVVRLGSGPATVPDERLIAVEGRVGRFDLPAYVSLWQRVGNFDKAPRLVADLIAEQLWLADKIYPQVRIEGMKAPGHSGQVRLTANLDEAQRATLASHLQNMDSGAAITLN